ncbi:TetR family transcriptional regulator [Rhizobium sp. Root274]|uniref:TetR/AcrR family transcriptional regulator n=1 Tax=unclassified Rhizobium TaxID=2613769 RepID=UPI000713B491|nr:MULTISPECIES: TetR/AcrR family transcriptional regulator [unclassified Rhizobium]KQW31381.1 TetR family transcriptional regulator [Rhizobium sp. Root1240]KRD32924.1 TetR family transcriptional regulator [Rhizobium sp. Root274]
MVRASSPEEAPLSAHHRKKQPEQVRRALLDCAARIAAEEGAAAITIQAVADRAGVTKGGLLHHFDSKQALLAAVFADLLDQLDQEIDRSMAADAKAEGRFTRAYVRACFADRPLGARSLWAALAVSIVSEPGLRALWSGWLDARQARHHDTDGDPIYTIVRLAADGVWLADVLEKADGLRRYPQALEARLLALAGG